MIRLRSYIKNMGWVGSYLLLSACGAGESTPTDHDDFFVPRDVELVTDDPFDLARLMVVQVQMSTQDFEALRWEGRSLSQGISECPSHSFEYTDFVGKVNIDGETLERVSIRKKGYLGSLSAQKPSLKLNFDTHEEGRTFKGLKRLTLNNNRQDPALIRQCLAYEVYELAGLNVPRCSWAQVYVNGTDMGVYTHVESIKKPFLLRTFANDEGNLYEAQLAEFGIYLNDKFELKTNKTLNDRSDLAQVAQLMEGSGDDWLATLKNHVDVDEFIQLWAADTVLGNWDSASGNSNNYYVYHNPEDDLFHFIPWGADAAFTGGTILKPGIGPLYQTHALAKKLFEYAATRDQYYAALQSLLMESASVARLISRIETMNQVVVADEQAVELLSRFVSGTTTTLAYGDQVLAAIENDGSEQTVYRYDDEVPDCATPETFDVNVNFSVGSVSDTGTFKFSLDGETTITSNIQWAAFGPDGVDSITYSKDLTTMPATHGLTLIGVDLADEFQPYVLQLNVEDTTDLSGQHRLHGFATSAMLFKVISKTNLDLLAVGESGSISWQNVTAEDGPKSGTFSLVMSKFQGE